MRDNIRQLCVNCQISSYQPAYPQPRIQTNHKLEFIRESGVIFPIETKRPSAPFKGIGKVIGEDFSSKAGSLVPYQHFNKTSSKKDVSIFQEYLSKP